MIDNVFQVIAKKLDAHFANQPPRIFHGPSNTNAVAEAPGGDNDPKVSIIKLLQQDEEQEFIKFPLNKVTPLLINIEEEGHLRPSDRFSRVSVNGTRESVFPDVRLNLYILFVSHFYDYTDALYYLSLIVKFFQANPVLDHRNTPELDEEIDKLIIELQTLPLSEQNEVWSSLRTAYRPSFYYRVKMLVFQDKPGITSPPPITELKTSAGNLD